MSRFIKKLHLRNLLSFDDCEVELQDLNVLIGPNGAGKSNLIEAIGLLRSLVWLGIESVTRIKTLDPIAELSDLMGLTVEGSIWTTQIVETLTPVGRLRNLRYLSLINLRSLDGTLAPLFTLRNLEVFHAAKWWDATELAELVRLNPKISA